MWVEEREEGGARKRERKIEIQREGEGGERKRDRDEENSINAPAGVEVCTMMRQLYEKNVCLFAHKQINRVNMQGIH